MMALGKYYVFGKLDPYGQRIPSSLLVRFLKLNTYAFHTGLAWTEAKLYPKPPTTLAADANTF